MVSKPRPLTAVIAMALAPAIAAAIALTYATAAVRAPSKATKNLSS